MRGQKRYKFMLTTEVTVEAENVAYAYRLVRDKVRVIGNCVGGGRPVNNRDAVLYTIEVGQPVISNIRESS